MEKIQLDKPTLILWGGVAAVGKTTLLDKIITKINDSFVIDKDSMADSFLVTHDESEKHGVLLYRFSGPKIHRPSEYYDKHVKFQHYHCMLALAKFNIQRGKNPIIDGNFSNLIPMGYLENVVEPFFMGVNHIRKIVYCHAPAEVIRERMQKRAEPRDKQFYESDEAWARYLEDRPILPNELERYNHIKINTSETSESNIKRVLDYLVS